MTTTSNRPVPHSGPGRRLLQIAKLFFFRAMDNINLRRLDGFHGVEGPWIAGVIRQLGSYKPAEERPTIDLVEAQRHRWLACDDALVDGVLGPGCEWDRGVTVTGACAASKGPRSAAFLHLLVRTLRPCSLLEVGTNVGISAAYLADALEATGRKGTLYTLEASPYRLRLARQLHTQVGLEGIEYRQGLFVDTLGPVLKEMGKVELAFIDGHHRYQPTLDYFELMCCRLSPPAAIVFDDIRQSEEMRRAWTRIKGDPRVALAVDLYSLGVCVVGGSQHPHQRLVLPPISYAIQHRELSLREAGPQLLSLMRGAHVRGGRRSRRT